MKKTITITAWNRPAYLRQVLDSLRANDCSGYELFVGVEPSDRAEEIVKIVEAVDWMPRTVIRNPVRLGVRGNPYTLLDRVFSRGSLLNIYLEDDVIVSPDAVRMANWYLETQGEREWLSLNFLNYESYPGIPCGIRAWQNFNALGMALRPFAWFHWFEPHWLDDEIAKRVWKTSTGWDWSITAFLKEHPEVRTLTPHLSRSNHIGREGGVHCQPEFHDLMFKNLVMNQDPNPGPYRIIGEPTPCST